MPPPTSNPGRGLVEHHPSVIGPWEPAPSPGMAPTGRRLPLSAAASQHRQLRPCEIPGLTKAPQPRSSLNPVMRPFGVRRADFLDGARFPPQRAGGSYCTRSALPTPPSGGRRAEENAVSGDPTLAPRPLASRGPPRESRAPSATPAVPVSRGQPAVRACPEATRMNPTGFVPGPVWPRPTLSGGPTPVHGPRIRTAPMTPLVA